MTSDLRHHFELFGCDEDWLDAHEEIMLLTMRDALDSISVEFVVDMLTSVAGYYAYGARMLDWLELTTEAFNQLSEDNWDDIDESFYILLADLYLIMNYKDHAAGLYQLLRGSKHDQRKYHIAVAGELRALAAQNAEGNGRSHIAPLVAYLPQETRSDLRGFLLYALQEFYTQSGDFDRGYAYAQMAYIAFGQATQQNIACTLKRYYVQQQGRCLVAAAQAVRLMGNEELSRQYTDLASKKFKDTSVYGHGLVAFERGAYALFTNKLGSAEKALMIAEQYFTKVGNEFNANASRHMTALVQIRRGDYTQAIETLRPVLVHWSKGQDRNLMNLADALHCTGIAYSKLKEYSNASKWYHRARDVAHTIPSPMTREHRLSGIDSDINNLPSRYREL